MPANTFDVIEKRKRITFFKLGKLWVFKNSFLITEWSLMRCWTITTKTYTVSSSDLPARGGFDYDLVEDLKGYVVELPTHAKYAQILKNSVAFKETANERLFLMKDLAAVEEAVGQGAKIT